MDRPISDTISGRGLGHPLVVVGSLGIGGLSLLTAVFFAGAFYNRVDGMERHLINIDQKMSALSDVSSYGRRLDALETESARQHDQLVEHEFYLKSDVPMPKRKP